MKNTTNSFVAKYICKKLNGLPEELVTRTVVMYSWVGQRVKPRAP